MRRVLTSIIVTLIAAFALTTLAAAEMPGPDAKALWKYITQDSPYKKWGFWPDHQGMQPGKSPHGPFHKVFVNKVLLDATQAPVPYGSIEVKDSYNKAQDKLLNITVQYKVKGFNPDGGDWFWAVYLPDGQIKASGKLTGCIRCHGVKKSNDYITVHDFK